MPDAPWTQMQVDALNRFQREGRMHPFTCPGDKPGCKDNRELIATPEGWVCVCGAFTQTWAHGFMMQDPPDWSDGSFYAATSREQDPEGYDKAVEDIRKEIGDTAE